MSRSYRKSPVLTDQQGKWWPSYWKRQANKKARKYLLQNGSYFKRVYNPYNICDYKSSSWWSDYKKGNRLWIAK